jgi:hypothetical protein
MFKYGNDFFLFVVFVFISNHFYIIPKFLGATLFLIRLVRASFKNDRISPSHCCTDCQSPSILIRLNSFICRTIDFDYVTLNGLLRLEIASYSICCAYFYDSIKIFIYEQPQCVGEAVN